MLTNFQSERCFQVGLVFVPEIDRRLSKAFDNRRRFTEAQAKDKARADYALEQIGLLYAVERRADEENLSFEERSELRSRLSYPIMVAFEK